MDNRRVGLPQVRWRWPAAALAAALVAIIALSGGGYSAPDNVHGAVYS